MSELSITSPDGQKIAADDVLGSQIKLPKNLLTDASGAIVNPATSGLQTTGNTSLASIDTKTPVLSSGKVPVIDSAVVSALGGTLSANILSQPTLSDFSTGDQSSSAAGTITTLGPMNGISFALLRISALTGAATINVQGSLDSSFTYPVTLALANVGQPPGVSPITAVGSYGIPGASVFPYLRVVQNNTGTATVQLRAGAGDGTKFVFSLLPDGFVSKGYGAVTTSAPTYTTGTTQPLSLDTAGNLRVAGSFAASAVTDVSSGAQSASAAGTIATIGPMNGVSFGLLSITALTGGATVNVQGSVDNTNWVTLAMANIGQAPSVTPLSSTGMYGISGAAGFAYLRAVQVGSGTTTVILRATTGSGTKFVWSLIPDGFVTKGFGAVTTAAPTYTTGTTQPLSLGTDGSLRVSNASLPLPTGASTSAKQPALGTAGTASADVLTVQGIASMTPLKTDGSATTQPVSSSALTSLDTKTPALGSTTSANSRPVVIASDQGAVATAQADVFVTGQGSQTANGQNIVLATAGTAGYDASGYRSVAIQINVSSGTVSAGAIAFEGSNDNASWNGVALLDTGNLANAPVTSYTVAASTNRFFAGPIPFRYFRARISTTLTGTNTGVQAYTKFSPQPINLPLTTVNQASSASLQTAATLIAGANLAGDFDMQARATTAGVSYSRVVSAASTNATSVKTSAGTIQTISVFNDTASKVYLKLYNKASAPTVGTDTPVLTIPIAAGGGYDKDFTRRRFFATGIAYAITGAIGDTDTTAVAVGVTGEIGYA